MKKYLIVEFPKLGATPTAPPLSSTNPIRPNSMSIGQWKTLLARKAREVEASTIALISKLDRWLASPLVEFESTLKSLDFVRL